MIYIVFLYVPGMTITILSICKYVMVYVSISRYMRVYARTSTKHIDKMCMTPGFEVISNPESYAHCERLSRPLDHEC
jgi:hypothetical protein